MRYQRNIDGVFGLTITDDLKATVTGDEQPEVTVQLKDEEQAKNMIVEFEDDTGELMQVEGSVFGSFPELASYIP